MRASANETEEEGYKGSMGALFGSLDSKELGSVLLFLSSRELLAWREVSKARRRLFASAGHAVKHGQRLLLDLHHSGLQLQALARLTRDDDRLPLGGGCGVGGRSSVTDGERPTSRKPLAVNMLDSDGLRKGSTGHDLPLPGCVWSVAHRGSSATHEGNSLPAFVEAVRVGATVIELDVVLCKTGEVVVHHDHVLTSEWLPMRNLGLDHIRAAHPHIVTIGDVLRCPALRDSDIRVYFDLKGDSIARPLMDEVLHAVVHGGWRASRLIVASFNQFDLLEINAFLRAYPEVTGLATAVIMDSVPLSLARETESIGASWISVGKNNLKPEFIRDAHARGLGVMAWTVNSAEEMEMVMNTGVDAIVTDHPEKIATVLAKMALEKTSVASCAIDSNDAPLEESAALGGVMSGANQEAGPEDSSRSDARGGRAGGDGSPSRLSQTLKALYRSLWVPRRSLVSAAAEASAMCALCTKVPAVGTYVSASPQSHRVMKELKPTVAEAEALAVELLHPSILSPVAREAAERALSDDLDSPTSRNAGSGESSSMDGCGIGRGNGSGNMSRNGPRQGSSCGSGSGSDVGPAVTEEQQTRSPVRGSGFAVDSDGGEEELFQFEKMWLRELALKGGGACDGVTPPPSPFLPQSAGGGGGDGEHQCAVAVVESFC